MSKVLLKNIILIGLLVIYGIGCMYLGVIVTEQKVKSQYFVNNSQEHLNGLKLDIPNEISELSTLSDTTVDLLAGYIDTNINVISLGFSGKAMKKDTYLFIPEHSKILVNTDSVLEHVLIDSDSLVRQKYKVKP